MFVSAITYMRTTSAHPEVRTAPPPSPLVCLDAVEPLTCVRCVTCARVAVSRLRRAAEGQYSIAVTSILKTDTKSKKIPF